MFIDVVTEIVILAEVVLLSTMVMLIPVGAPVIVPIFAGIKVPPRSAITCVVIEVARADVSPPAKVCDELVSNTVEPSDKSANVILAFNPAIFFTPPL